MGISTLSVGGSMCGWKQPSLGISWTDCSSTASPSPVLLLLIELTLVLVLTLALVRGSRRQELKNDGYVDESHQQTMHLHSLLPLTNNTKDVRYSGDVQGTSIGRPTMVFGELCRLELATGALLYCHLLWTLLTAVFARPKYTIAIAKATMFTICVLIRPAQIK